MTESEIRNAIENLEKEKRYYECELSVCMRIKRRRFLKNSILILHQRILALETVLRL